MMTRCCLLAFVLTQGALIVCADVTFTDGTFNPADYTQTASFIGSGATSIAGFECASCGDPGKALQITAIFGDTTKATGFADVGFVNNTFDYNPSVNGAIETISTSVDKDLNINISGSSFTNTFRPLIEQDGIFYLAVIHGPTFSGGDTGFLLLSQAGLTAADFQEYDFSTNAFLSGTPNFAGDPMSFGLGQISGIGGFDGVTIIASYDNLSISLQTVPEVHTIPEPIMSVPAAGICFVLIFLVRNQVRIH